MGRRRKNELKPGDNVTIYIPQDVEREVLHFMRTQVNLSKTVFKILENYVLRKTRDYAEFDDFYGEKSDVTKQFIKDEGLRRSFENKDFNKISLENEIKEFIRNTIKSEIKNIIGATNINEQQSIMNTTEKSEIKSRHEDKLKVVQNILESEEFSKKNAGDMDELFSEFSRSIEEDSEKKVKNIEFSKSYLWDDE
jgi:predicted DNA-binding protein (UPF0278 family)